MNKLKQSLIVITSVLLMVMASSCATTPFSEKIMLEKNEMTTFTNMAFDGVVKIEDLKRIGSVEAKRTVIYNLQLNGDYSIEMGDFKYNYIALDRSSKIEGTRVIGNLKTALAPTGVGSAIVNSGFMRNVLGSVLGSTPEEEESAPSVSIMAPKTIALEAVNYDLMKATAAKGGVAILMPEYSWEIEEEQTGTSTAAFLFLPASKAYSTKILTYTVTARATAVSF